MIPLGELAQTGTAHLFAHHPVLADGVLSIINTAVDPTAPDNTDNESNKAGPWGLGIILLLGIACYFLFRSMSRHLRKVREEFPEDPDTVVPPTDGTRSATSAESAGAPGETTPPRTGPAPTHPTGG